ncbi:MAG: 50S ribosomal protein L32 [Candidatus Levybacteria bacterium]|nr:50S ribosomal protein L32 [Candidatus Levybacteria bacterium]
MPHEPKKRHSRQRQGKRRSSIKQATSAGILCPNCGTMNLPHTICKKCGYYKGKQIIKVSSKTKEKTETENKSKK